MKSRSASFQRTRAVIAWVLAFAIAALGSFGFAPSTPQGKQCPTAAVQEVVEVKYVKTCCGKVVPVKFKRAPREGEAGFKQCQCAEKKAADKDDQARAAEYCVVPQMHVAQALPADFAYPIVGGDKSRPASTCRTTENVVFSPPTPPPQFI